MAVRGVEVVPAIMSRPGRSAGASGSRSPCSCMAAATAASPSATFFCWKSTMPSRKFHRPPMRPSRHRAVADADAGLVEHRGRPVRIPEHGQVLRVQQQQRDVQLPEMIDLGPSDGGVQGRKHAPVTGHQVRHLAIAKGFLQDAAVGKPAWAIDQGGGVRGLLEVLQGRRIIAADHRQPPQLEEGDAGERMVEFAAGHHRAIQGDEGLTLVARGRHAPRPVPPPPRPATSDWAVRWAATGRPRPA